MKRSEARVCWWNPYPKSWVEYIIAPGVDTSSLPGKPPENVRLQPSLPTLFGHYWRQGIPNIDNPMASCIDYSVAAHQSGYLCAYEFFIGDTELKQSQLHYVIRHIDSE